MFPFLLDVALIDEFEVIKLSRDMICKEYYIQLEGNCGILKWHFSVCRFMVKQSETSFLLN